MAKISDIDLALDVLCRLAKDNQTLSFTEIAEVCGCSSSYISAIGRRALEKCRVKASRKNLQDFLND